MRDLHHHGDQTETYRQALPMEIQNTPAGSAKARAAAKAARTNATKTCESLVMTDDDRMIANQLGQTPNVEKENRSHNVGQRRPDLQATEAYLALLANATADAAAEGDETYEPATYTEALASTAAKQ
jgi:hypothetical protein